MKNKALQLNLIWILPALATLMQGCAVTTAPEGVARTERDKTSLATQQRVEEVQLPVRFQKPGYMLKEVDEPRGIIKGGESYIPIGVNFSPNTSLPLRGVLKRLAERKSMTVSWASDVNQNALVDVSIKEDDDFYTKIGDILRQLDYSYEVKGDTIIVKYRVTKKFHIAMPFTASNYSSGVGGNVLGSSGSGSLLGTIELKSPDNKFDIWDNIKTNLDTVLEIWTDEAVTQAAVASADTSTTTAATDQQTPAAGTVVTPPGRGQTTASKTPQKAASEASTASRPSVGKGYYTIDKPIGLVTVTAPQSLLKKVEDYISSLKSEIYRQVAIEAKIVEVELSDDSSLGIDWSSLFSNLNLNFNLFNGGASTPGQIYPGGNRFISTLSISNATGGSIFPIVLNALKTEGTTNVLSNPKLSVINGQPALLSIGKNVTYIDSVTTTISDSGIPSTSITTASVMSGIGMAVIATIMDKDEIVLTLTPVTSQLTEPIQQVAFGTTGNIISLPEVKIREMNTMVRIKDGDLLVIGGLIDTSEINTDTKPHLLGDIPFFGRLFSQTTGLKKRKELVIFLQPRIIS